MKPFKWGNGMINLDEFITKSNMTHGGYYSYSKTTHIDNNGYVTITCPKHGDFNQKLQSHMTGSKCPKCSIEKRAALFKLPIEDFKKYVIRKLAIFGVY